MGRRAIRGEPLQPKQTALAGPRDLKTVGSEEWIIQTTLLASIRLTGLEHSTEEWLKIVAELEGQCVWEKYPARKPYGTREAYFLGELGRPEPELTRAKVEQQLMKHGGDRRSEETNQARNTRLKPLGESQTVARIRARLKRDGREDLLAKIERGETTANAVAIDLKWRSKRIWFKPTVDGFAAAARKHLNRKQQTQLIAALEEQCASGEP